MFLEHLEKQLKNIAGEFFDTLYIGGGTPTLLSEKNLSKLINIIQENIVLSTDAEISIEANPETLTSEKIAILRPFFNRISVGVQSFDSNFRQAIGRKCSSHALQRALKVIKNGAFPHWNIDLMYSLPGQSMIDWEKDLRLAGESGADHISCYSLTPEEGARMGGEFSVDDELEARMFELAGDILSGYGIDRYEISNYAKSGCECRHNCDIWQGGTLAGFGPSAAGFDGKLRRYIEPASLKQWLQNDPPEIDEITPDARRNEIFAINLRTVKGWSKKAWMSLPCADSWEKRVEIGEKLQKFYPGALTIAPDRIKLSRLGLLYWNNIAQDIL